MSATLVGPRRREREGRRTGDDGWGYDLMVGGRCNILATAASRGSHKIGSGDERDAGRADKGEVGAGAALVGGGGSWCCSITISILGIAGNSRALWVSWSGTAEVL